MKPYFLKVIRGLFEHLGIVSDKRIDLDINFSYENVKSDAESTSNIIYERLNGSAPFLVSRFGANELLCQIDFMNRMNVCNSISYILSQTDEIGWRICTMDQMRMNAGFYPSTASNLKKYAQIVNNVLPQINILGSWMLEEKYFFKNMINPVIAKLEDLEPYYHKNPWTKALTGKKVLVIHPFEATIKYQYENNRTKIFKNSDILPEFELLTLKAVQSIAQNDDKFTSWFDAFEYMKTEIDEKDFDIAIIGCGAYGMPLAGYVKTKGKKAIHLGGATQLLFGIRGKRWEEEGRDFYKNLMNEHWIRPLPEDYPRGYDRIENGCYW